MLTAVRSSWALLFGIALIMLGNGLQGTLLGLRATIEGFTTLTTGLIMSGYYVGFLVGSQIMPNLVQKVGHVRVFAALASLASAAVLLHTVLGDPWIWCLLRILTGISYAGLYIVAESWLNDQSTNQNRGQILSIYMVISLGGLGLGQLLLNVTDPAGSGLFILVSVLISLAVMPILLTTGSAPDFSSSDKIGIKQLYRASPLGVIGCMSVGMVQGSIFGMGAVYANNIGMSVAQVSYFMFAVLIGGIVLQWPLGRLSDSVSRRRLITAINCVAAALSLAAIHFSGATTETLLLIMCLYGGMSLPLYSICVAYTNDRLEPKQMVAASGTLVLVRGIGSMLGPAGTALLMAFAGANGFLWFLAAAHALVGLLAVYRMTRRSTLPVGEQRQYPTASPRESVVAASMAARAAETRDQ